jgi:hypothetical protein
VESIFRRVPSASKCLIKTVPNAYVTDADETAKLPALKVPRIGTALDMA